MSTIFKGPIRHRQITTNRPNLTWLFLLQITAKLTNYHTVFGCFCTTIAELSSPDRVLYSRTLKYLLPSSSKKAFPHLWPPLLGKPQALRHEQCMRMQCPEFSVVHTCNPRHSGSLRQEDGKFKASLDSLLTSWDSCLRIENLNLKRGAGMFHFRSLCWDCGKS